MENVIAERVKHATLTKAQQKIADYFIRNPERVGMCSSMEVAKEIGVSDASIIRFARAIGYEGFTDLKNDIYNSLAMQASGGVSGLSLSERYEMNRSKYGGRGSREDYIKVMQYNQERTFQQNGEELFDQAVSRLISAKNRYVIGFRGCLGIGIQCAWLLRFLLDHVTAVSDEGPGGIGLLQDISSEDCALFFSLSRYYKSDLRLATLCRERGASLIVVTDGILSPMAELADVLLIVEDKQISFFNSTAAVNMISEYLITKVAQQRTEYYQETAKERDLLTEELRL